jgi:hypothetical protein
MDISTVLTVRFPEASWSIDGDKYEGLEWLCDLPKPSETELEALWPLVQHEVLCARVQAERQGAYIRDADPLFFGYQRGENTEQEWLDAVQAVKDAHPYPENPVTK